MQNPGPRKAGAMTPKTEPVAWLASRKLIPFIIDMENMMLYRKDHGRNARWVKPASFRPCGTVK
jgi:hypothetical protein